MNQMEWWEDLEPLYAEDDDDSLPDLIDEEFLTGGEYDGLAV